MLDTVIFNRILDGSVDGALVISQGKCFVTHIQRDELSKASTRRQQRLLDVFAQVDKQFLKNGYESPSYRR